MLDHKTKDVVSACCAFNYYAMTGLFFGLELKKDHTEKNIRPLLEILEKQENSLSQESQKTLETGYVSHSLTAKDAKAIIKKAETLAEIAHSCLTEDSLAAILDNTDLQPELAKSFVRHKSNYMARLCFR